MTECSANGYREAGWGLLCIRRCCVGHNGRTCRIRDPMTFLHRPLGGRTPNAEERQQRLEGLLVFVQLRNAIGNDRAPATDKLLDTFFGCHVPTEQNKTQYRSVIFTRTPAQHNAAVAAKSPRM